MIASARSPLAILAVVVLASITAHSEPNREARSDLGGIPWSMLPIVPPAEFDHDYPGMLRITRLSSEDAVRAQCPGGNFNYGRALGCSFRFGNTVCVVYIATDELLESVGIDYETALRHERGHCNGWPNHHPGARYLENPKYHPFLQFPK
jgi:hypothetical protein